MNQSWADVFTSSLQNVWLGFANFVPNLIVAILIFVLAWVLGSLLGRAVRELFAAIKLDRLLDSVGLDDMAKKAGVSFSGAAFLGAVVRWFVIIVGLIVALDIVGLRDLNTILTGIVVGFIPKVVIACIVLIAAAYLSRLVSGVVSAGARSVDAGRHSTMFATVAKYAIWIFAFIIALSQLGIGAALFQTLFTGAVLMLAIAGGLAFGLGGKDHASRMLDKVSREMSER
jgi:small-conductance mechanosensitive channel